jgi:hypothetical protein
MTETSQTPYDFVPPPMPQMVVMVLIDGKSIAVVTAPRALKLSSKFWTFRNEIDAILGGDVEIVHVNLIAAVFTKSCHSELKHNDLAGLFAQFTGHIGGESLIVVSVDYFNKWVSSEEYTISNDFAGAQQAEQDCPSEPH